MLTNLTNKWGREQYNSPYCEEVSLDPHESVLLASSGAGYGDPGAAGGNGSVNFYDEDF